MSLDAAGSMFLVFLVFLAVRFLVLFWFVLGLTALEMDFVCLLGSL